MKRDRLVLLAVRVGLPVGLAIAGVVLIVIGGAGHPMADNGLDTTAPTGSDATTAAGVVLIGVGLLVWMINWLYRMTISSGADRDAEDRNRDYYTEHGHWPGEKPD